MGTLYDRIIAQLDTLVPFLALAREEVFDLIHDEHRQWFPAGQRGALPKTFLSYRTQVAHSAFLLGYSYFEAFLSDLAREVFRRRPMMLPQSKELKYSDVLNRKDYGQVLEYMVEREVVAIFYNSMEKIAEYFEDRLSLHWPRKGNKLFVVEASLVRNCIVHNGARIDRRLAEFSGRKEGAMISLDSSEVHSYGIEARDFAYKIYEQASKKHFRKGKGKSKR